MTFDTTLFSERRARFGAALGESIAVIPAATLTIRNSDVEHAFRQDSDFFYLTGFEEPDAVAVLNPSHPTERFVLFVRPSDKEQEVWTGYRAGVAGARESFGADAAYPLADLDGKLREYLLGREILFYRSGNSAHDARIQHAVAGARAHGGRLGHVAPLAVQDPSPLLHEQRLIKTKAELGHLRRACDISAAGHREAMRFAAPGIYEYQVQAAMEYVFRISGSPRNGYGSILASGANACILHYVENSRLMAEGDLLLIDAAAEFGYYSSDITRTFPVSGGFTAPQRAVYDVVLAAQRSAIDVIAPGANLKAVSDAARRVLAEGMIDVGLLPGPIDRVLAMHHDREFFYHGTSHWLGLDVHDAGAYRREGEHRPLEPGMVFTVEPGLYMGPDTSAVTLPLLEYDLEAWIHRRYLLGSDAAKKAEAAEKEAAGATVHEVPAEFLGIGVRIEDDMLVTDTGWENLTAAVPVDPDEIEALCAEGPLLPTPT